ncbi:hypothetical protein [Silvibacterium dinghuense]|uniref:Uncharacterized protein n=1 Tax=Silvibacterium dinghuense TaxID=1560006 RepID=A0A4Q1SHK7_9BACT|nr:hypothetical protein [Silvibacterium dinghuense]RXS96855.1 hypothetical protein ESZ00_02615 [Silvibacterium dinghuense]GGG94182.1 hypothetical protein GCM10011586_06300 [Silvibacterium dinghuense]
MLTRVRQAAVCVMCCVGIVSWCQGQIETGTGSSSRVSLAGAMDTDPGSGSGGSPGGGVVRDIRPAPAAIVTYGPLARIAVGGYVSPLGGAAGIAAEVTRSTNLRLGWNFFNYNLSGTDSGATYDAHLHFRSLQASLDWFPFRGHSFHVSPGILFNNQNRATAVGGVPGGDSFTLNGTSYYGSYADPVVGDGAVHFKETAPMFTFGWGNWVSRKERRHITFPFEMGFVYQGTGSVSLHLQGSVCEQDHDVNCSVIATDPEVQANIQGQIRKLDKDLEWIRFYPILSSGVALRF